MMKRSSLKKKNGLSWLRSDYDLYLMLLPCLCFFILFKYVPMAGIIMAFQDYTIAGGLLGSEFVGLKHFKEMFQQPGFLDALRNALYINFWKYLIYTPAPLILAIMINEVRRGWAKKTIQTICYFPNFISWIIVFGILTNLLNVQSGLVNRVLSAMGLKPIAFMISKQYFVPLLVITDVWKYVGIDSIVYLSALTGIDPGLYEAAKLDGANKMQQIRHITVPGVSSTFFIMLILSLGRILDAGHDQIIALYSKPVYEVADVLTTYIYRTGIGSMRFSYSAAVGLFSSLIGLIMVCLSNWLSRKYNQSSVW